METLFRFVLTRPAESAAAADSHVVLSQDTDFQAELGAAQQQTEAGARRAAVHGAALKFARSGGFVGGPNSGPHALAALGTTLDDLQQKEMVTNAEVADAIEAVFGATPRDLASDGEIGAEISALKDSILAIKLLPEEHRRPIQALTDRLRDLELIGKVAEVSDFPGTGTALRQFRGRSVRLPTAGELRSSLTTRELQEKLEKEARAEEEARRKAAEGRLDLYRRLTAAVADLTSLSADHYQVTPQVGHGGFMVPKDVRPLNVLIRDVSLRDTLTKVDLQRADTAIERAPEARIAIDVAALEVGLRYQREVLPQLPRLLPGNPAFEPRQMGEVGFRLAESARKTLSGDTLELLKQRGLDIGSHALDDIVRTLRTEVAALGAELDQSLGRATERTFKRVGTTMVMISTPAPSAWNKLVIGNDFKLGGILFPPDLRVPHTHGNVAPAGVADLLVVKQQLVRYEAADVAHIENVLKGESKSREHTTRRETEEFSFLETETTTTDERELESTTRFEMSQETNKTIKEDASVKAGLSISGKYGPTVEFSASAEATFSSSKEEATKAASRFSQDVTERSAHKVTERVLERSSLRVTNEVIEKNTHGIDNTAGAGHIAGVYQWVNKVYQAQVYNYGIRVMYDFMVPEPAVFLITSLQTAHANAVELEKPTPFTLRPDQIFESTYPGWVQQYGATDVQPPPEIFITKVADHNANAEDKNVEFTHSAQIAVDDGYKAVHASIGCVRTIWEDEAVVDVVLGGRTHRFSGGDWLWSTALDGETGAVPFAMVTDLVGDVALAIEVRCQRTDRAYQRWQLETHAKLTTAYKARLSEYEEKLKALEIQAGVEIRGQNPLLNLEMMMDELKKHCITILTEQHFDLFNAVQVGGSGVEQINLYENEAEGPYVRFFEQAFEWEQMTWLTYPYFWGRKSQWRERLSYADPDPVFNQFLKAGYCRVVVPVRPSFEGAVDHFITSGDVWNGGPLPTISNELYLPISDEIAERLNRPGEEIPQGDPWLVRLPTTLVHLRPDDKLPVWTEDANGEWVEA